MTKLGELLVRRGKLSPADLSRALEAQNHMPGERLGRILVRLGLCAEVDVAEALAEQLQVSLVRADRFPSAPPELGSLNPNFLHKHALLPLGDVSSDVLFVTSEPNSPLVQQALRLALHQEPQLALGLETEILATLEAWFQEENAEEPEADFQGAAESNRSNELIEHLKDLASEAPVIRWVNQIFAQAVEAGASDIHLEPFEDTFCVRARIDGVLQKIAEPPLELAAAIVSRVKLLAHLDIAERRLPQDGRMSQKIQGRRIDVRVSTVPTRHGESVVLRLLERDESLLQLEAQGFEPDILATVKALLTEPHGIFLLTGPTGSGKTTTLYAALRSLDTERLKILTVEDPVEYELPGVNQVQVQEAIGLTFASALRAFLRQDPDVIMVGEMRDAETAQIAVQAALTGHLVLSTLHTNTAAGAAVRLHDLGVERYLITSSVIGVLAQRLVRTLCARCKTPLPLAQAQEAERVLGESIPPGATLFAANGCPECRFTGYKGRIAIHELLTMTPAVKRVILAGGDSDEIDAAATSKRSLLQDGARKVFRGVTTVEEVLRVAHGED
ncbi:MAG: GspE/PulE family protein [Hydrogenophilus thermoluteolus]